MEANHAGHYKIINRGTADFRGNIDLLWCDRACTHEVDIMRDNESEYLRGLLDGIQRFAYWKDGIQYVGSCGKTLSCAIKEAIDQNAKTAAPVIKKTICLCHPGMPTVDVCPIHNLRG